MAQPDTWDKCCVTLDLWQHRTDTAHELAGANTSMLTRTAGGYWLYVDPWRAWMVYISTGRATGMYLSQAHQIPWGVYFPPYINDAPTSWGYMRPNNKNLPAYLALKLFIRKAILVSQNKAHVKDSSSVLNIFLFNAKWHNSHLKNEWQIPPQGQLGLDW